MRQRVKKWTKRALLKIIHFTRLRPGIKVWALKGLQPFPAIEARLRRLSASPLSADNSPVAPTIVPVSCLQLNEHALGIYEEITSAGNRRVTGRR
jgi:hypothetical protein